MKKTAIILVVVIVVGLLIWFWPKPADSPVNIEDDNTPKVTETERKPELDPENTRYLIEGKVKILKNGTFTEKLPEFPAFMESTMLSSYVSQKDIDRDGDNDIIAIVNYSGGGTGTFAYLSVVINDDGVARPINSVFLGDRIKIENFSINTANEIKVTYFEHSEDQSFAEEPNTQVNLTFKVSNNTLVSVE